uniref:DDE Tnp4 domain-containing protein n=1 Tax=Anopheles atroparvus TaxID=41427 RepID=A0AAG5DW63_ANOAO
MDELRLEPTDWLIYARMDESTNLLLLQWVTPWLMAVVDSNYKFIMFDVGGHGSISDGGCLQSTTFYKKLTDGRLQLPPEENIENTNTVLPYVFVGDEAFGLRKEFLKPYNRRQLNYSAKIFNYRLSRARRVVENAFGILTGRFQIFQIAIRIKQVENIQKLVLTACYLHNFLRCQTSTVEIMNSDEFLTSSPMVKLQTLPTGNSQTEAIHGYD